jgi:hypothetical protein
LRLLANVTLTLMPEKPAARPASAQALTSFVSRSIVAPSKASETGITRRPFEARTGHGTCSKFLHCGRGRGERGSTRYRPEAMSVEGPKPTLANIRYQWSTRQEIVRLTYWKMDLMSRSISSYSKAAPVPPFDGGL